LLFSNSKVAPAVFSLLTLAGILSRKLKHLFPDSNPPIVAFHRNSVASYPTRINWV
jgi:hypothetical protein